ncbi:Beta-glucosidase 12 [Linum perenne]
MASSYTKKDYVDYCDLLFKEYGSKVKKWITLNEPMIMTAKAYDEGVFPPGHCSPWVNRACRVGDSGIEPYIVAHNLLLAHSAAYHLYKSKYQHLTGEIGVTYITHWFVPYSNATKDVDAAQRALDWMFGWFMDPITFGNYPRTMIDLLGSRLPKFTEEESRLLRKSFDFLGLNYYTAFYVKHNDDFDEFRSRYATDSHGITTGEKDGVPIGPNLGSYWQYFYHEGLRVLLLYIKETYMDPAIYITENGLLKKDNATQTLGEALRDESRIDFYNSHLTSVLTAMKEKQVNVKGYFAWSYVDNFEWAEGYTVSSCLGLESRPLQVTVSNVTALLGLGLRACSIANSLLSCRRQDVGQPDRRHEHELAALRELAMDDEELILLDEEEEEPPPWIYEHCLAGFFLTNKR